MLPKEGDSGCGIKQWKPRCLSQNANDMFLNLNFFGKIRAAHELPSEDRPFARLHSALRMVPVWKEQFAIWTFLLVVISTFTLTAFAQQAQQPHPAQRPPSNRFLIIVDTSASMKKHLADITNAVSDLILNAASGQMHPGDSLGFWTFNQDVFSDLPAQTWTADDCGIIAARTVNYLQHQRFTKSSRLDKALDGMQQVIQVSDILTVFIISTGEGKMSGTPFDTEINAQYKQALKDMKRNRRPVVTVLQAKSGRLIRYTVNALPWPIIVPEVPIPILAVHPPPQNPARTNEAPPTPKPTSPPPAQNLILSGPSVSSNAPVQPVATPVVPKPVPTAPPPEVKVETPTTTAATQPATTPQPTQVSPATLPPVPAANLPPPPAPPPPSFKPPPIPTASTNIAQQQPVASNPAVQAAATRPIVPPEVERPLPPPVAPESTAPTPATNTVHIATTTSSSSNLNAASASTNTSAHAMAFVAPDTGGRSKLLLIGGLILVLVAAGLIALMVRRSRVTSGPSLITHSMGNTRKH